MCISVLFIVMRIFFKSQQVKNNYYILSVIYMIIISFRSDRNVFLLYFEERLRCFNNMDNTRWLRMKLFYIIIVIF